MAWHKMAEKVMVRIYLTESQARLKSLLKALHRSEKVKGVTVFHGSAGIGTTEVDDPTGLAKPQDPPVVLEFWDDEEDAHAVIKLIRSLVQPNHIVMWHAQRVDLDEEDGIPRDED